MTTLAGRVVGGTVGLLPPSMIRAMAKQYSAGDTLEAAMAEVAALGRNRMSTTLAVLGEAAVSQAYAATHLQELLGVVDAVANSPEPVDARLGVKPTALGIDVSLDFAAGQLDHLAQRAQAAGCIVEIDMEQLQYVDGTLALVRHARAERSNVYAVVQAYLHRTSADVDALIVDGIPARLVKGTYKEPAGQAFQLYESVRANYLAIVRKFLTSGVWVGIATHDEYLIAEVLQMIRSLEVPPDRYEFQMIMGVQTVLRQSLVDAGHPVRVTVNFGADMHLWSVRRLKENPEIARYAVAGMRDSIRRAVKGKNVHQG